MRPLVPFRSVGSARGARVPRLGPDDALGTVLRHLVRPRELHRHLLDVLTRR